MNGMKCGLIFVIYAVLLSTASAQHRVVALSTGIAPGTGAQRRFGDFVLYGLGAPVISNSRDVWFTSGFVGVDHEDVFPDFGIFVHRAGATQLALRQNMPMPAPFEGAPLLLGDPNDGGEALTFWSVTPSSLYFYPSLAIDTPCGCSPLGYWSTSGMGPPTYHANEDLIPAGESGIESIGVSPRSFSDSGPLVLEAYYAGDGTEQRQAILTRNTTGEFTLAARVFDRAPGTPEGNVFDIHGLHVHDFSSDGWMVMSGVFTEIDDLLVPYWQRARTGGFWKRKPGAELELVAIAGQSAPGTDQTFRQLGDAKINAAGSVVFSAALVDPNLVVFPPTGVWTDAGGNGIRPVTLQGRPAPGAPPGFLFKPNLVAFPFISDSGKIAVWQTVSDGAEFRPGIWEDLGDGARLVALMGAPAPDAQSGTVFDWVGVPALNEAGQLVFEAGLTQGLGGVTDANDGGVWAQDRGGVLRLVLREGDLLETSTNGPSVVAQVTFVDFVPGQVINDLGEIVMHVTFTDGVRAIVVSNVVAIPEPDAWLIAITGVVVFVSAACRRIPRVEPSRSLEQAGRQA
jgi:hypothetical protein